MNIQGNARARQTKEKIYNALLYLLKHKSFDEIYVKDICIVACIDRSSFYKHYYDINDLMRKTESELSKKIAAIFSGNPIYDKECFVKLFEYIKENKDFYSAYLKYGDASFMGQTDFNEHKKQVQNSIVRLDYSQNEIIYHMAFFSAGVNAVCKVWLNTEMKETPEQMAEIIHKEYSEKIKYFSA